MKDKHRWRWARNGEGFMAVHEKICDRCGLVKGDFFMHNFPNRPINATMRISEGIPSCDFIVVQRIMES